MPLIRTPSDNGQSFILKRDLPDAIKGTVYSLGYPTRVLQEIEV